MVAAAAVLSWFLVGLQAALMRGLGVGKTVRSDGPESHLAKTGTPSMGGVAFTIAAALLYLTAGAGPLAPVFLLAAGYGLLGLADDLGGLYGRPLKAREKLALQLLMALVFAGFAVRSVSYTPWTALDYALIVAAVVGAANAFNFTDGLDGLAAGVTAVILLPFLHLPLAQVFVGALLGFLWHNAPKARIFMGDAGSQLLGALVAGIFVLEGKAWYLPLAAAVPVLEVVSVVVQVVWFRRTGRRLLRMAPLHHHFELSGWSEAKVVFRFVVVTAVATALAVQLWGGGG
ncbi:MraY family glycosyltransferase [Oceanithermus profundus]|uniref:Phospho-N-acetylmuramoyl-pentapeptide-transferase n=1 Tax=Oceanithermus profundus (strain DSM 14977 / NBRC 100410 / VKM B-2274 / 506) TaxID=670487 RepID=E4U8P7_OCEP5|nr:phospho-N-acetylmuramoyl-pentapeptide-transferase [Oceanithermus profundus]ADR36727.1 Phospho-N-acetylmuramoyl-pentapeptide-transferase [Oceanithermus profundus DSM 14977]